MITRAMAVAGRARGWRWAEALAVACAALAWAALAARFATGMAWSLNAWLAIGAALVTGLLGADLLSGAVHFACDRFFSERTPLVGRAFIAPFREHHRDPDAIARHGLCERSGNNCIAVLPLLACAHAVLPERSLDATAVFGAAFALALSAGLAVTNEVHAWAHRDRVPAWVAALQRAGVVLSPRAHALHHEGDHRSAYCITTGWCNPALDRARIWPAVERTIRRIAGSR